eukprot:gene18947-20853_t
MDDQAILDQLRPRPSNVDYFDIDDILASQERIPCKFELPVYRLGFLDPSSSEEHIQKGVKMELPYWMSRDLCTRRRKIVSVEMPKVYGESYRQIYKADANALDLHKMGPYFYKFGVRLLHFEYFDAGTLARSLLQVFRKRFRKVMDAAQNASYEETSQITSRMDNFECNLFRCGQKSQRDFQIWKQGETCKIKTSSTVLNHRKRKRTDIET